MFLPAAVRIEFRTLTIRGYSVLLDFDLAEIYGVTTRALNYAVKRNAERFPDDFMFQLTKEEVVEVAANCDRLSWLGGRLPALPFAFTEEGMMMLSSVLNSRRAIHVNVEIMRGKYLRGFILLSCLLRLDD